jgi:preprotein translocase subunit YajC
VAQQLFLMLAIVGVFYFVLIRPQQKRAKEHREMLQSLKKGDLVITSGGLIGKVSGITDNVVTLEVAEKIRLRVIRSHIASRHDSEASAGTN